MPLPTASAPLRTPRVPEPPHDPKSLLLAGWIGPRPADGWRLRRFVGTELGVPHATVTLARTPDAARRLTEVGGSFGGLRLPPHLTLGPQGDLYLLDRARGALLHLDACSCAFEPLHCGLQLDPDTSLCTTPLAAPRHVPLNRLRAPSAIAACDGRLLIADTGHARVLVFALAGFVPRGALVLPRAQSIQLGTPWRPSDLVFDRRGRLFVLDAVNGRIDRFDANGHWAGRAIAAAGAQALWLDACDTPVVIVRTEHVVALPALTQAQYLEIDALDEFTDWQLLRLDGIGAGSDVDLALGTGATPLGSAQLAQLPAGDWTRRADRLNPANDGQALPLALDTGRWLRVRLTPRPASSAPALTLTATSAQALRLGQADTPPTATPIDLRADRLQVDAPRCSVLPIAIDALGRLFIECPDGWRAFDEHGASLPDLNPPRPRFKRQGRVLSTLLDAQIDGCPWHRVELRGHLPPGCSVEVRTTTAPLALADAEIDTLDDDAWCTRNLLQGVEATDGAEVRGHDCLILSPPGRYLWLQLILRSDGASTPCIESVLIEFPRISLRRYLPAVYGTDPAGADFTDRFGALFDATLRSFERPLDRLAELFDPLAAPSGSEEDRLRRPPGERRGDFLSWLEQWVGVATVRDRPERERRQFLSRAGALYGLRGTREGLWRQLLLLLGMDDAGQRCAGLRPQTRCVALPLNCASPPTCSAAPPPPLILEHFKLRRWLHAGIGRLGDDAQLWGAAIVNRSQLGANAQVGVTRTIATPDPLRDPLLVQANRFCVFLPASVRTDAALSRALDRLLASETPAHVLADVRWVGPRFTVGRQAMVGLDSVVARTPQGVRLQATSPQGVPLPATSPQGVPSDNNALGQGTVLTAPRERAAQGFAPVVGAGRVDAGNVLH